MLKSQNNFLNIALVFQLFFREFVFNFKSLFFVYYSDTRFLRQEIKFINTFFVFIQILINFL